jgi:hypothetical protein
MKTTDGEAFWNKAMVAFSSSARSPRGVTTRAGETARSAGATSGASTPPAPRQAAPARKQAVASPAPSTIAISCCPALPMAGKSLQDLR